jgi:ankyrin repeat protein
MRLLHTYEKLVGESIFKRVSRKEAIDRKMKYPPALINAVLEGETELVRSLIDRGVDLDYRYGFENTALMYASNYGYKDIVELLLRHGADVNAKNEDGSTALIWASSNGRREVVELLLRHGADVNANNNHGWSALSSASESGHMDIVQILKRAGGRMKSMDESIFKPVPKEEVQGRENMSSDRMLYNVLNYKPDAIEAALDMGFDVNRKINGFHNALQLAVDMDSLCMVRMFLARPETDVNVIEPRYGWSPLYWALMNGFPRIANLLLDRKDIDVAIPTNDGDTPLALLERHPDQPGFGEIAERIRGIIAGGRIEESVFRPVSQSEAEERKLNDPFAIMAAARMNDVPTVKRLLDAGVDENSRDRYGDTALIWASANGYKEIVRMLLDREDIAVNTKNRSGYNALIYASKNGHKETVRMLLDKGADVNMRNVDGFNALMFACRWGCRDIVRMLLDKGIDVNLKDKYGWNALMYALNGGYKDIVDMLKQHGAVI